MATQTAPGSAGSTGASQAQIAAANLAGYLKYARRLPLPVQTGTFPSGSPGGSGVDATFNPSQPPVASRFASDIYIYFSVPITLTIPASATATVSLFAPYCMISNLLELSGMPTWPLVPGTAWWLDEITSTQNFDPAMQVEPVYGSASSIKNQAYGGPTFVYSTGSLTPGGTVVNASTAVSQVVSTTLVGRIRVRLQQSRKFLWGAIPLGDPQNRPNPTVQLNSLVGGNPAENLIQDIGAAGITCTLSSNATVNLVWAGSSLDQLPANMGVPMPKVGMALQVTKSPWTNFSAGSIEYFPHRTSMIYRKVFELLFNNSAPVTPDYQGFWTSQEQQAARFEFTTDRNNQQNYYEMLLERYHRYLPQGVTAWDFISGDVPDQPDLTPYDGLWSPDVRYAAQVGTAPIPAANTALRIPTGTSLVNANAQVYEFGLVNVSY